MTRTITFLLTEESLVPVGGFKVVYEYANRLARDGWKVNIVYPNFWNRNVPNSSRKVKYIIKQIVKYLLKKTRLWRQTWFRLEGVKEIVVWKLTSAPKSDYYVATTVATAFELDKFQVSPSRKIYFIQGYENWMFSEADIEESYRFKMKKICVSPWLVDIVVSNNGTAVYVPNAFDFTKCRLMIPIEKRRASICMLYNSLNKEKRSQDGVRVLELIHKENDDVIINVFGVEERPKALPDWITYYQNPSTDTLNQLYNESAIFIATSRTEGWGLTVGEAMICGCAVACTNALGFMPMAIDGITALVSPANMPEILAANVKLLLSEDNIRFSLAKNGHEHIRKFTWESSYREYEDAILNNI